MCSAEALAALFVAGEPIVRALAATAEGYESPADDGKDYQLLWLLLLLLPVIVGIVACAVYLQRRAKKRPIIREVPVEVSAAQTAELASADSIRIDDGTPTRA